jgi:tetratricopeptide (TPR) repeat protein
LKYYERWNHFENCIVVYKNIAILYSKKSNHQLAIECIEKALNIQENSVIPKDKEKLYHLYNLLAILNAKFGVYCFN